MSEVIGTTVTFRETDSAPTPEFPIPSLDCTRCLVELGVTGVSVNGGITPITVYLTCPNCSTTHEWYTSLVIRGYNE